MKKNIKYSIIIPAYNVEDYILETLQSAHLFSNCARNIVQIIVVNDCSTDNTLEIINKYGGVDLLINNKKNIGLSRSRSIGIMNAVGEYVINLDGDDLLYGINVIELDNLINKKSGPDVLILKNVMIDTLGKIIKSKQNNLSADIRSLFTGAVWNKIVKKSILQNMVYSKYRLNMTEDLIWSYEIFCRASSIVIDNKILYAYRLNPQSLTQQTRAKAYIEQQPVVLEAMIELFKCHDYYEYKFFIRYWFKYVAASMIIYNSKEFKDKYLTILKHSEVNETLLYFFSILLKSKMLLNIYLALTSPRHYIFTKRTQKRFRTD